MRALALAAAIILAGCFGLPAGSADLGDTVAVRYVAVDPGTGQLLAWRLQDVPVAMHDGEPHYESADLRNAIRARLGSVPAGLAPLLEEEHVAKARFDRALQEQDLLMEFALAQEFVLGSGQSALGFLAESQLVGMQPNETRTVEAGEDATRSYTGTQRAQRFIAGGPYIEEVSVEAFTQFIGQAPQEGQRFEFNILHEGEVESVQDGTVRVRVLAEEGQSAPADFVGATIVTHTNATGYSYELVPETGARFIVETPRPGAQTPLGLPPGGYRVQGIDGDQIVYDHTPIPTLVAERDVHFVVRLVSRTAVADEVPTGDFGKRNSAVLPYTPDALERLDHHHGLEGHPVAADDGHGHQH